MMQNINQIMTKVSEIFSETFSHLPVVVTVVDKTENQINFTLSHQNKEKGNKFSSGTININLESEKNIDLDLQTIITKIAHNFISNLN